MRQQRKAEVPRDRVRRLRPLAAQIRAADLAEGAREDIHGGKQPGAGDQPVIERHSEIHDHQHE